MLAVICDGTFKKDCKTNWCSIRVKKQRKKDELRKILNEWGKEYVEKYYYYGKKSIPTKKNVIKKMNDFNKRVDTNVMNLQNEINKKKDVKENNNSKAEIQLTSKPEKSITNNDNFLGKTNEILKQINEYIDKEKNNLK